MECVYTIAGLFWELSSQDTRVLWTGKRRMPSNMIEPNLFAGVDGTKGVDGTFQNGIFQNRLFGQTGIFQNGIFQRESSRKYFQQNRILSEWNLSEKILQKSFSTTGQYADLGTVG
jgi:hypothetical protein